MGMLERIKKKQWDGFKDFVESMEVTSSSQRPAILLNGILEDPKFMSWVTKNLRGFKDFLDLPGHEIEQIVKSNESILGVLAKAIEVKGPDDFQALATSLPRIFPKLKDEIEYAQNLSTAERESAQFFLIKAARKMQRQELIQGFRWELPPPDLFQEKLTQKEGVLKIFFVGGILAAEGEMLRGKRSGKWSHYYDNGKLLAEGTYVEGLKQGKWSFYYGQGTPKAEGKFVGDVRQGIWREWDRNGNEKETEWVDGKKQV